MDKENLYIKGVEGAQDFDKAKTYFDKIIESDSHFKNDAEDYISKM